MRPKSVRLRACANELHSRRLHTRFGSCKSDLPKYLAVMRLRLEYFDHNEEFARLLPRDGMIERFVSSADDNPWALFRVDTPVEYDGRSYDYFLLRSRLVGHEIGDAEPTSVFILLVDDVQRALDGFNVGDFEHVDVNGGEKVYWLVRIFGAIILS